MNIRLSKPSLLLLVIPLVLITGFKSEVVIKSIEEILTVQSPISSSYVLNLTTFASHSEFEAGNGSNPSGTVSAYGTIKIASPKDGSGRVFISSQTGKILVFAANGDSLGVFLDLATISGTTGFINGGGASAFRGLMYFDFHPNYSIIGKAGYHKLYVGYQVDKSYDNNGANANYRIQDYHSRSGLNQYAIAEFTVSMSDSNSVDHSSFREVFRIQTEGTNPHGIGEIAFNPNVGAEDTTYGLLYVAIGDGSAAGNGLPATGYLQGLDNPFGKILCINPLQNDSTAYSIPVSNPYYGQEGVAQEIYAIGFRDPQTFSFTRDEQGNDVLVTFDIGAAEREEISIVRPGGNYGWERFEGTLLLSSNVSLALDSAHSPPVVEYDHSTGGFAIVGGLLVSDPNNENFKNKVIFSDLPTGKVFYADYMEMLNAEKDSTQASFHEINNFIVDGISVVENSGGGGANPGVTFEDVVRTARGDLRFGHDEQGNVYFVTKQSGTIFKTELVYTGGDTMVVDPDTMVVDPDTMVVDPDTMVVDPDTMVVDPDTMVVDPDTMVVDPDTMVVDPDTMVVDPDTMVVDPDTMIVDPDTMVVDPDTMVVDPDTMVVDPDTMIVDPDTMVVDPDTSEIVTGDLIRVDVDDQLILYPNPSNGVLFVKMPPGRISTVYNLSIYNGSGQVVVNRKMNNQLSLTYAMDISALEAGTYLVELTFDRESYRRKIVVR